MNMTVDDDPPILIDEPRFTLDAACPTCHGTGVMEEGRRLLECTCVLRQRISHYLTPQYGPEISWHHNFPREQFMHMDVLLENTGALREPLYRELALAAVKSFLLVTGQRFSHRTLTPYDIFLLYLANLKERGLDNLASHVDVLIIRFGIDPPNNSYQSVLPWLIRRRRDLGLSTWILSAMPPNTDAFEKNYPNLREPLMQCLVDGFAKLPIQPTAAGKGP
jgi:hypothetical protein